jgi:hypothetical protein
MAKQAREDWAKRIERWKDSGLTAKEFAVETGISARSPAWWQWKLGAEARQADAFPSPTASAERPPEPTTRVLSPKRRRRRSKPVAAPAPMTFVEVRVHGGRLFGVWELAARDCGTFALCLTPN